MKLIAHRGWSQGGDENTLDAFARAAADPRVAGVEFDVRRDPGSESLLVTHDPAHEGATLTFEAALTFLAATDLELFVETKDPGIAPGVIDALVAAGVADRAVVFAFADVARGFPWEGVRPVRLGAILVYPWTMQRAVDAWRPDMVLLGWDDRPWTRLAFRAWWSLFPLGRLGRRLGRPVVVGIVQRSADLDWLRAQGVYGAVADMDLVGPTER